MYKDFKGKWIADTADGNYKNPILFSDYSDPDVIRVGDDFFMTASSFTYFPGLPVLHSKDMVNWKIVSYALRKMPYEKFNVPQHGKGVWAPSIRYHDGSFYIYFADPDLGIFMCKTNDPFGEWDDVVLVRESCGWIDTCPFWDDDGCAYLIRGVAKSRIGYKSKLFLHKMSADGTKLLDDGVLVFDGRINHPTIEGPKMYKRNGYYYILAPAGGVPTGWQMAARSKNIYGPYEHKIVLHQGDSPINGPHQGGLVELENGENWFIHFQDLDAYGRIAHLQPVHWVDDWCEMGVDTNKDKVGEPVLSYKKPVQGYDIIEPLENDEFEGDKLGLQWQWQAHENKSAYEIADSRIRLYSLPFESEKKVLADTPHLLTQLMHHPNFMVTAKVKPNLTEGDSFGLVITGGSYTGIRIEKSGGKTVAKQVNFTLAKSDDTFEEVSEEKVVDIKEEIYIRLKVTYPCIVECSYSLDGKNYVKLGENGVYKVSKRSWVGGKVGIFSVNMENKNGGGYSDFDYVRFSFEE